jgi:hypothetical protein
VGTTFFVFDSLKIYSTMRKDNKARGMAQPPRYRYSIVYHQLRNELGISIFQCCLLDTVIRQNLQSGHSRDISFLAIHLRVSRGRIYDALESFYELGLIEAVNERGYAPTSKAVNQWEEAQKRNEGLRFTKVFPELRREMGIEFKAYCLLDAVYHLSKSRGESNARHGYFEKVFGITERDFRDKREKLGSFLIRTGERGLKLTSEVRSDFSHYYHFSERQGLPFP